MPNKHAMSIHQSMIYGRIMNAKNTTKSKGNVCKKKTGSVVYDYKYECLDKSGVLLTIPHVTSNFEQIALLIGFEQVLNTTQIDMTMVL